MEDDVTGYASASIECAQFGTMAAWWNPTYLPPCAENLTKVEGEGIFWLGQVRSLFSFDFGIFWYILERVSLKHPKKKSQK